MRTYELEYFSRSLTRAALVGVAISGVSLVLSPWNDPGVVAYAAEGPSSTGALLGLEMVPYAFAKVGAEYGVYLAVFVLFLSIFSLLAAASLKVLAGLMVDSTRGGP